MDLETKEVAELLHVPEQTLIEWAEEGKIPSYKISNRYRFNRTEIEDWVLLQQHKETEEQQACSTNGQLAFNLFRALHKGDVFCDIEGNDKATVIKETMKRLASRLGLDAEVLSDIIMQREELMSTSVGSGFAIPHTRDFLLKGQNDVVVCVYLKKPIDYDALDGEPVHTLFFLFASDDKRHLSLLSKIAYLLSNQEMKNKLKDKPEKAKLLDLVQHWEATLHNKA